MVPNQFCRHQFWHQFWHYPTSRSEQIWHHFWHQFWHHFWHQFWHQATQKPSSGVLALLGIGSEVPNMVPKVQDQKVPKVVPCKMLRHSRWCQNRCQMTIDFGDATLAKINDAKRAPFTDAKMMQNTDAKLLTQWQPHTDSKMAQSLTQIESLLETRFNF